MKDLTEIIKGRKSVRTYDGMMISEEHRKDIEEYFKSQSDSSRLFFRSSCGITFRSSTVFILSVSPMSPNG